MIQPELKDININIPEIGKKILCKYSRKDSDFIYIEFGFKSEGRIKISEFSAEDIKNIKDSNFEAEFIDDSFSFPILSIKRIKLINEKESLIKKIKNKEKLKVKFTAKKKDHLIVNVGEYFKISGKIYMSEIPQYLWNKFYEINEEIICVAINDDLKNCLFSISEAHCMDEKLFFEKTDYKINENIEGEVLNISDDSVLFIFDGLIKSINNKYLTWNIDKNIKKIFKKHHLYKFKIIKISKEKNIMELEYIQKSNTNWDSIIKLQKNNEILTGQIINIKDFGIFIGYENVFNIFISSNECSWNKYKKNEFIINKKINFKILEVDIKNKNIKGSIKRCEPSPEEIFYLNKSEKIVEVSFTKELEKLFLGKTVDGLNCIMFKNDISWNPEKCTIDMDKNIRCKINGLSKRKDSLRVGVKQLNENPWIKFKEKYKIKNIMQDNKIIEINKDEIIIDIEENNKAIFPLKLVSESSLVRAREEGLISGIVNKINEKNNRIILNNLDYERVNSHNEIKLFKQKQGDYETKLGDLIKIELK